MRKISARNSVEPIDNVARLAKLAAASLETLECERDAASMALSEQMLHFQTAIDNIVQGLCTFNASAEMVVCNRTYLRMYQLSPEIVKPGCTLRRLIEHRREVGLFKGPCPEGFDVREISEAQTLDSDCDFRRSLTIKIIEPRVKRRLAVLLFVEQNFDH